MRGVRSILISCLVAGLGALAAAQDPGAAVDPLHRSFDQILDLHVRDGLVYYRMLESQRGGLDRYVASLDVPAATYERWTRDAKLAFWINAYNAFVLQTVINHFPIRGRAADYPATSIRQIPGAFDRLTHRAAGQSVTLDGIEKDILVPLGEPRAFLALGRGAVGSGRLRSEAYDPRRLDAQLEQVAAESLARREIVRLDMLNNQLSVTPIFSWREPAFVASFEKKAAAAFSQRSPIERAVLGLIAAYLKPSEVVYLEKNTFKVSFHNFDWRLNDLSNRPPDGF